MDSELQQCERSSVSQVLDYAPRLSSPATMCSTTITTCGDAYSKPAFPLPPEIRVKVYEELLIHPHGVLEPNGHLHSLCDPKSRPCRDRNSISTSILRTCRYFYEESLPILYGENLLRFHDNDYSKPVLPFPEEHLTMVKHASVDISPCRYSSAEEMGSFLMTLSTSGAKFVDLNIRIRMLPVEDNIRRELYDTLPPPPPLSLFDRFLCGDHPIVAALFSLKAVKNLRIYMEHEACFEPGVARALKKAFMKEGTVDHRSIIIERICNLTHDTLAVGELCPGCRDPEEEMFRSKAGYEYQDDILTCFTAEIFHLLGGKLKMRHPGELDGSSRP